MGNNRMGHGRMRETPSALAAFYPSLRMYCPNFLQSSSLLSKINLEMFSLPKFENLKTGSQVETQPAAEVTELR